MTTPQEKLACANKLEAAALVIQCGDGEWWTQGAEARNAVGFHVPPSGWGAECFCADGAYRAVGGHRVESDPGWQTLRQLAGGDMTEFNDAPGRTAREVASLMLDAADQLRGESVAWMRPWEGDVSDENHFLFVSDANERDGMEWVPLFRSPAAATAALQARVTELEGVLRRYVAQDIAGDHFHGTKFEASSLHKDARAALNKEPKNV